MASMLRIKQGRDMLAMTNGLLSRPSSRLSLRNRAVRLIFVFLPIIR